MIKKILKKIQAIATVTLVTVNTIFWGTPILVFALFKLLLPIAVVRRRLTRWIMAMGESWVGCNAIIFRLGKSTRWDVRGLEQLSRRDWYLVISNHQTWVDIIVLQTVFKRRIPFLKFFIKHQLIWFPILGLVWWAMDMPFMKRYTKSYLAAHPDKKGKDLEETRKACEKFRDTPTSVINCIEGTRYSEDKSVARASPFEHLLPPRAGGIALALTSMGTMFDSILDVTIVYPRGITKFWEMCSGDFEHVVVEIRQRPVEEWMVQGDYANDREFRSRFHQWLTSTWREKDSKISAILQEAADS